MTKKIIPFAVLLSVFYACDKIEPPVPTPQDSVTLDKTDLTLTVGDKTTLTATASTEEVTWASSDEEVATVADGTVTAVGAGEATITVTAGDANASCKVTVEAAPESELALLPTFKKVSTFPTITITTEGSKMPSDRFTYIPGSIKFEDPDGMYSDVPLVEGTMQIRGRGNTSFNNPKKAYKIKLDEKSKVFGMKGDRDWAILAEYSDGSMLRNQTAMQVSRIVGMPWTPDCCSAEVIFNGKKLGLYTLIEHKEVGDSKVKMNEGSYFLELDDKEEDAGQVERFTTPKYYKVIKFKDPDEPTDDQKKEVKGFFTTLENTLAASPSSAEFAKYKELMNVDSFIRNFIVQELTKNVDGNLRLSTPMVLEDNELRVAMVWDFDLSLGNGSIKYYDYWTGREGYFGSDVEGYEDLSNGPTGWWVRWAGGRPAGWENPNGQVGWYQRMFRDPEFTKQLKVVWNEVYANLETVPGFSDVLFDLYKSAIQREYDIWKSTNYEHRSSTPSNEYKSMIKFYKDRLKWMNDAINSEF